MIKMDFKENRIACFVANYPECLGERTECPNLMNCHNQYAGIEKKENKNKSNNCFFLYLLSLFIFGILAVLMFVSGLGD